jgi:hypothetical protein
LIFVAFRLTIPALRLGFSRSENRFFPAGLSGWSGGVACQPTFSAASWGAIEPAAKIRRNAYFFVVDKVV